MKLFVFITISIAQSAFCSDWDAKSQVNQIRSLSANRVASSTSAVSKPISFYESDWTATLSSILSERSAKEKSLQLQVTPQFKVPDEHGNWLRLHEYFGRYSWGRDESFQQVQDSVMAYWLFQLMNFEYDHGKLRCGDPTWQSVEYTWRTERGVCRDSATLLADMLGAQEYDARLVVGDRVDHVGALPDETTGHAWVVVRDSQSGAEYLLESTQETWDWSRRFPPRTATQPEYLAVMQVNYDAYFTPNTEHCGSGQWSSEYTDGWDITPTGNPRCWINQTNNLYGYSIR